MSCGCGKQSASSSPTMAASLPELGGVRTGYFGQAFCTHCWQFWLVLVGVLFLLIKRRNK